jgi:hypothetical protein
MDPNEEKQEAGSEATSAEILQKIEGLDPEIKETATPPPEEKPDEPKPESGREDSNLVRKLRKELEEKNRRLREIEEERAKRETPPPPPEKPREEGQPPAKPGEPAPKAPEQTPEQLRADNEKTFAILDRATRAMNGELVEGIDGVEKAQRIHALAMDVIRRMSPEELLDVQQRAESGAFGAASARIADLASREISVSLGHRHVEESRAREASAAAERTRGDIAMAMDAVHAKYPALKPAADGKETEELKFAKGWFSENIGTDQAPGIFFEAIRRNPKDNIPRVFDRLMADYNASKLQAAGAERDRLRQQLDGVRNPEGGTRPAGGGTQTGTSAEILEQLKSRGLTLD